jgi:hypothetical protein
MHETGEQKQVILPAGFDFCNARLAFFSFSDNKPSAANR